MYAKGSFNKIITHPHCEVCQKTPWKSQSRALLLQLLWRTQPLVSGKIKYSTAHSLSYYNLMITKVLFSKIHVVIYIITVGKSISSEKKQTRKVHVFLPGGPHILDEETT